MKGLRNILIIFLMLIIYAYFVSIAFLPDEVTLLSEEKYSVKTLYGTKITATSKTGASSLEKIDVDVSLFGKFDVKTISVNVLEDIEVVPIGKIIGLKLYTNGVLIVGMSEIENINNEMERPFENVDIKEGDTIIKVNEIEIDSIESLKEEVNNSNGNTINLTLVRDGSVLTSNIIPTKTEEDEYKLGLWVRDAATGVGTITYYEPETKQFAALGHGITDSDTDKLIDIESGELVTSNIVSIKKGAGMHSTHTCPSLSYFILFFHGFFRLNFFRFLDGNFRRCGRFLFTELPHNKSEECASIRPCNPYAEYD